MTPLALDCCAIRPRLSQELLPKYNKNISSLWKHGTIFGRIVLHYHTKKRHAGHSENKVFCSESRVQGTTPVPEDDFCWDFFEMYYEMTGSSAKLDQWNTSFVGILLGQTPAIGGCGRYDRAACRDIKQTCREVARARHIERRLLQLGHSDNRRRRGRPNTLLVLR